MRIVVLTPVTEEQRSRLEAAAPDAAFVFSSHAGVTADELAEAEIVVGNVAPARLREAPKLRFLQLDSAGFDSYAKAPLPDGLVMANASGCYGPAVSEHMLAMLLGMMKRLPAYRDDQRAHVWRWEGHARTLDGANVLVLGAGDIGTHFARLVVALGAHVAGCRRHAERNDPPFERMLSLDEVRSHLGEFDVVASALPSTPETRGLADDAFFSSMREGSFFVNAGRGDLVDQDALVCALTSGHLAGAALDVCVPEPLPVDDPLWDTPNLLLTPHQAGRFNVPATLDKIIALSAKNIERFLRGEDPINRFH
ncbi:MAG: D-2-hydroxyacid dehydrogenase [Tractidigestivibacter sp.]|jgi:phosphoglycerate dehydrogenase-like enzyme|uniref:D-2-hydroxyacid dehydrogenase n=1 Tax=Tractidigestivibacter sp. TaxID=2847320 RepID=UPI003D89D7D5